MPMTILPAGFRAGAWCRSKTDQMPRKHLRVLPARTRPSLFAGD
jgi:hypothetical protein